MLVESNTRHVTGFAEGEPAPACVQEGSPAKGKAHLTPIVMEGLLEE